MSSIALTQIETNQVEAVIRNSKHVPRFVIHLVSDNTIYIDMLRDDKNDPYAIAEDFEGWDKREHYQGASDDDWDDDNWETIWEADNKHEFRFLFPIMSGNDFGYIGHQDVGQPSGDYLCMRVSYQDNNADLKDHKQIALLTLEDPVQAGANNQFTANQNVYWSVKKADDGTYDTWAGAISTNDQTAKTFT